MKLHSVLQLVGTDVQLEGFLPLQRPHVVGAFLELKPQALVAVRAQTETAPHATPRACRASAFIA
eukprot:SAG31_NODE_32621_length_353_cov_1.011811_1_plen_64_part_10